MAQPQYQVAQSQYQVTQSMVAPSLKVYIYELQMYQSVRDADLYATIEYGGERRQSAMKKSSSSGCTFNEKIEFGFKGLGAQLSLAVFEKGGADETFGRSQVLNVDQLDRDPTTGQWYGDVDLFKDGNAQPVGKLTAAITLPIARAPAQLQVGQGGVGVTMQPAQIASQVGFTNAPPTPPLPAGAPFAPGGAAVTGGGMSGRYVWVPDDAPPGGIGQTFLPTAEVRA